ncbi:hypothetical protein ACFLR8_01590 [Bacteroidota bacterium]
MKKSLIISFVIVLLAGTSSAQENPIRIGLKFGVPNIVGFNFEYVTPVLGAKLAPTLDLSYFSLTAGEAKVSFSYFELGSNYYFLKEGKSLYGHLSYGRIGFKGSYSDPFLGDGEGKVGINILNIKLGGKFGNSFYFRPELGYGVLLGGSSVKVEYTDPTTGNTVTEEETVPGFLGGGILFNLGFGFAF